MTVSCTCDACQPASQYCAACAGLAINMVMVGDTLFVSIVMLVGWRVRSPAVALFAVPVLALELLLLSSNLNKVPHGEVMAPHTCMPAHCAPQCCRVDGGGRRD